MTLLLHSCDLLDPVLYPEFLRNSIKLLKMLFKNKPVLVYEEFESIIWRLALELHLDFNLQPGQARLGQARQEPLASNYCSQIKLANRWKFNSL